MISFYKQGHRVLFLNQVDSPVFHLALKGAGIEPHVYVPMTSNHWIMWLKRIIHFVRFCNRNSVNIVYSHLEPANFVAAVGQFLVSARVFICRHHIDEAALYNFQNSFACVLCLIVTESVSVRDGVSE